MYLIQKNKQDTKTPKLVRIIAIVLGLTILATACGSSGEETTAAAGAEQSAGAQTSLADTDLGSILVDGRGLTLYGFTDDTNGISTCYDDCASAWPPHTGELSLAAGLPEAGFSSIARDDGTTQILAGNTPLYTFVGDGAPGDVTGQGSGGVWFVVSADGQLITGDNANAAAAETDEVSKDAEPVAIALSAGEIEGQSVLTDAAGFTLYAFTNDTNGVSNCNSPCSETWPPVLVSDSVEMDLLRLTALRRADNSEQLAVDGRALYRYAGDEKPGDTKGHLVGDVWFALNSNGGIIAPQGISVGSTDAGDVLINAEGFTLYTFAKDGPGVSNCDASCAINWPPVPAFTPIDGSVVAIEDFDTHTRDDGSVQLTLEGAPLYSYVGDEFPGDANGRAIGDGVWTSIDADDLAEGDPAESIARAIIDEPVTATAAPEPAQTASAPAAPVAPPAAGGYGYSTPEPAEAATPKPAPEPAPAAAPEAPAPAPAVAPVVDGITISQSSLGQILVDADGLTLYAFTNDTDGVSNCNGACANAWPPVPANTSVDTSQLNAGQFKTIQRADGSSQLAIGKWALYYFAGDAAPGDVNGQGSGGVWFVVSPNGSLIK